MTRRASSANVAGEHPEVPQPRRIGAVPVPRVGARKVGKLGLDLVVSRPGRLPYFEMRMRLAGGSAHVREGSAVPRMLRASFLGGTRSRSAEDIARTLDSWGCRVWCTVGADGTVVGARGLSEHFEDVVALLSELVFENEYPEREVELCRSRVAQQLAIEGAQPARIAGDALRRAIYGRHPYGRTIPSPDAASGVARREIRSLHRKVFRASGTRFVVVSDLGERKVEGVLRRHLDVEGGVGTASQWSRRGAKGLAAPRPRFRQRTVLVDRPGSVQTVVRIGMRSPRRQDPDYHAFLLANTVLGGYFSSRLVENVREEKGYAYGISSSISHRSMSSSVVVSTDVATEVTGPALVEIFYELDRIRVAEPEGREVESARRYLVGSTTISLDTYGGLASTLDALYSCGLDETFLQEFRDRLYGVSPGEISNAAASYFDPSTAVTVLVGDAARIEEPVRRLFGDLVEVVRSRKEPRVGS